MKIFKFYIREKVMIGNLNYTLHAGSNISTEEAQKVLQKKVEILREFSLKSAPSSEEIDQLRNAMRDCDGNQDGEYTRAIFEEIIEEIDSQNCITRNYYGAEVLNSENLCFIDVDIPQRFHLLSWFFHLFSKKTSDIDFLIRKCETLLEGNADLGIRLYQTAAGFRLILSGENLTPRSERFQTLSKYFNADTRYTRLCTIQDCFRARLTPKPARIHLKILRNTGEFDFREKNAQWVKSYHEKSQNFATCRLLRSFGNMKMSSLIQYHDVRTRIDSNLPLA